MPPEASRKRRRTGPSVEPLPEPIVIMTPSIQPDVRLVVLELYSNYFRRFLDSPDKASSSTSFGQFKYDYATMRAFVTREGREIQEIHNMGMDCNENVSTEGITLHFKSETFEFRLAANISSSSRPSFTFGAVMQLVQHSCQPSGRRQYPKSIHFLQDSSRRTSHQPFLQHKTLLVLISQSSLR